MGLAHSARLASHPDATLIGFFDPDNDAASDLRDRFAPDGVVATSFEELLKLEANAVVIGTPTTAHREQVEAAASRGWHVLCEKPLAENRVGTVASTSRRTSAYPVRTSRVPICRTSLAPRLSA